ncbi:MAG: HNH endonuclease [Thaumarchaeota archaeon]|nr:HNH endonuclease [Nitrososphaerota archaeon]
MNTSTVRGVPVNAEQMRAEGYRLLEEHRKTKTCPFPGCEKKIVHPQRVYCSQEHSWEFSFKFFGLQWDTIRREVIERDNHTCQLCGRTHSPREIEEWKKWHAYCGCEVDHIVEVDRGGTDDRANLRVLCSKCHRMKTDAYVRKKHFTPLVGLLLLDPWEYLKEPFQETLIPL